MSVRQPTLFLDITPAAGDTCPVSTLPTPDRTLAKQFLYREALQKWLRDSSAQREHEIETVSRHVEISLNSTHRSRAAPACGVSGSQGRGADRHRPRWPHSPIRTAHRRSQQPSRVAQAGAQEGRHCAIGDIRQVGRALFFRTPSARTRRLSRWCATRRLSGSRSKRPNVTKRRRGLWSKASRRRTRVRPHFAQATSGRFENIHGVRFIEVKGRAGVGEIFLSANEYRAADRLKTDYWLYAAFNCAGSPELHTIQNPTQLQWQPVTKVEQFKISPQVVKQSGS